MLLINKVDRAHPKERLFPFIEDLTKKAEFVEIVPISATRKSNLAKLPELIARHLPESPLLYPEDQVTDSGDEFMAAEIIREKLMLRLQEELPYGLVVQIEGMGPSEDEPGKLVVQAVIWVERAGQKPIVIGKGGELAQGNRAPVATGPEPPFRQERASRTLGQGQGRLVRRRECAAQVRLRVVSESARRISLEPAFLLHHYPWRDTSRILELLTRAHGRVAVIARASRRANSALGGSLQLFSEMLASWSGRGEMGNLNGAERVKPPAPLAGDRLMSGFYANELLLKLLPRNDPHPVLFDAYATLLGRLVDMQQDPARALRVFEKRLLEELGWGLNLEHESGSGAPLDPGARLPVRARRRCRAARWSGGGNPDILRRVTAVAGARGTAGPAQPGRRTAPAAGGTRPLPRRQAAAHARSAARDARPCGQSRGRLTTCC